MSGNRTKLVNKRSKKANDDKDSTENCCAVEEDVGDAALEKLWSDVREIFANVGDEGNSFLAEMKFESIGLRSSLFNSYWKCSMLSGDLLDPSTNKFNKIGEDLPSNLCYCPPPPLETIMKAGSKFPRGFQKSGKSIAEYIAARGGVDEDIGLTLREIIKPLPIASNGVLETVFSPVKETIGESTLRSVPDETKSFCVSQIASEVCDSRNESVAAILDCSHFPIPFQTDSNPVIDAVLKLNVDCASSIEEAIPKGLGSLGKRGRLYSDIWNENDFMTKNNLSSQANCPLKDWSEIFVDYSDNHDGFYREWLLSMLRHQRRQLKTSCAAAAPHLAPPVPVSIQHPACWGLNARINGDGGVREIQRLHPASCSDAVVHPPCKSALDNSREEDLDDLNLLIENDLKHLILQDCLNEAALIRLQGAIKVATGIDRLRSRRRKLQKALEYVYKANEPRTAKRRTFVLRATVAKSRRTADIDKGCSSDFTRHHEGVACEDQIDFGSIGIGNTSAGGQMRYATRCSSGALAKDKHEDSGLGSDPPTTGEMRLLGSCLEQHVDHGSFVSGLEMGKFVEVRVQGIWKPGLIHRLRYDGECLLKFVKVSLLNSFVGDAAWVAVSDGHLAPPRTHLTKSYLWVQHQHENVEI